MMDRGVTILIKALEDENCNLLEFDISGNQIGQSSYIDITANQLVSYFDKNSIIEKLYMS